MSGQTPATDLPAHAATPYLWCSDCRTVMRDRYFALNERPICAKCRAPYVRQIERTDGRGAMWRVGLQGALVALLAVPVLTLVITLWPPARIFLLIPIGYLIGKRMMRALEGYSNRRYQYIAVALTYLCFLVGFTIPAALGERAARERRALNRARMQGTMATQSDALKEELATIMNTPGAGSVVAGKEAAGRVASPTEPVADIGPGPGLSLVLFLFSPFLAMIQFGLLISGVGLFTIAYALYQAWAQTDGQGMFLKLRGPFRVGQGPIPAR
jgi:hypothetical protein